MLNIENHIRALSQRLDLPAEAAGRESLAVLSGSYQLTVEGHRGICRYDPVRIEIRTAHEMIAVEGEGLQVSYLSTECISIRGKIRAIQLEAGK